MRERSAIGFTIKSGWACAVLVSGSPSSPRVTDIRRVDLSDPADPEARQPYHAGFGTARGGGPALSRLVGSVKRFGRKSASAVIRDCRKAGHDLRGAGLIVGSLIDPATIGNDHIRIHALEGQLFRSVVQDAAARNKLACTIWRERDVYAAAAAALKQPEARVRARVAALSRSVDDSPWRAEHKAAALAAWLVLASAQSTKPHQR